MTQKHVLVLLSPEDPDAELFRSAVHADDRLREGVDLQFASAAEAISRAESAEVIVGGNVSTALLDAAHSLRWIAFWSAGLDGKVTPRLRDSDLLLTNASGVHGPNIAEQLMTYMLMFARQMPFYGRAQLAHEWERTPVGGAPEQFELEGQTLGIVGLGRIGEALAMRARAFGMRILATKRDVSRRYDSDVPTDGLYSPEALPEMLGQCDHVCIAVPYTPETHHLFNATLLAQMKPSAYLYNIARGKIVDEDALAAALLLRWIAGAGLDVFEEEPLPAASPLWGMSNVIITPHVSGLTPAYFRRFSALFTANLRRYIDGAALENLFDADRGY